MKSKSELSRESSTNESLLELASASNSRTPSPISASLPLPYLRDAASSTYTREFQRKFYLPATSDNPLFRNDRGLHASTDGAEMTSTATLGEKIGT